MWLLNVFGNSIHTYGFSTLLWGAAGIILIGLIRAFIKELKVKLLKGIVPLEGRLDILDLAGQERKDNGRKKSYWIERI